MNKRLTKALCLLLCLALAVGFSSCGMLKNIREHAARKIYDTPAEDTLAQHYNGALKASLAAAQEVRENTSYSVGRPTVEGRDGKTDILAKAADTLKSMIMGSRPGAEGRVVEADKPGLLRPLDAAAPVGEAAFRDESVRNVTDENGKEVTDEEGNVITETVIVNNLLKTDFYFYTEETVTYTDENGEEKAETTRAPLPAETIEAVFGPLKEKAQVLAGFDAVKGYFKAEDYTVEYKDCTVHAETDLETGLLQSVVFTQNMQVTAQASGDGPFAEMGAFNVSFGVTKTVDYVFTYAEDAQ